MAINNIVCWIRTFFGYTIIAVGGLLILIPLLIALLILPERYLYTSRFVFTLLDWWYRLILKAFFISMRVHGNMPHETAIIVANHQSALDIPVIGVLCHGHPHSWYVLDYYANKPIIGFFIRRLGMSVTQNDGIQGAKALILGMRRMLDYNCHIILFPEGGRYVDGDIHPFLPGFALLARKTGRPVLPLFLRDVGALLPPKSCILKKHFPIDVIVGPLYAYQADETDEQFVKRVYDWFKQQ